MGEGAGVGEGGCGGVRGWGRTEGEDGWGGGNGEVFFFGGGGGRGRGRGSREGGCDTGHGGGKRKKIAYRSVGSLIGCAR